MIGKYYYLMYNRETKRRDTRVSIEDVWLNAKTLAAYRALAKAREKGAARPYAMLAFKGNSTGPDPGIKLYDGSRTKFVSAASVTAYGFKQITKGHAVLFFKFDPETLMYNEISFEDVSALAVAEKPEKKRRKKNV